MKNFITFLCLIVISNELNAQQVLQQTINASGNTYTATNFSITSNIGQSISATLNTNNTILTQGFLQPFSFDIKTFLSQPNLDNNFIVYPTLTSEGVFYELQDKTIIIKGVEIYDVEGHIVLQHHGHTSYISLATLPDGIYWLRPIVDNKHFSIKKIVKTQ